MNLLKREMERARAFRAKNRLKITVDGKEVEFDRPTFRLREVARAAALRFVDDHRAKSQGLSGASDEAYISLAKLPQPHTFEDKTDFRAVIELTWVASCLAVLAAKQGEPRPSMRDVWDLRELTGHEDDGVIAQLLDQLDLGDDGEKKSGSKETPRSKSSGPKQAETPSTTKSPKHTGGE